MDKNKFIHKISFNITTISSVLLGGIVLSHNYQPSPEVVCLTGTCLVSSYVFVKSKQKK